MGFSFKLSELPEQQNNYEPIPPGEYSVQMESVEEKQTASGEGVMWNLKMKIVSDKYKGRTFFLSYNVENKNNQTQEIARREIGNIARLIGVSSDDISLETIKSNKILTAQLDQRPVGDKVYYNVKKWSLGQIPAAPSQQATTTKAAPPWIKK